MPWTPVAPAPPAPPPPVPFALIFDAVMLSEPELQIPPPDPPALPLPALPPSAAAFAPLPPWPVKLSVTSAWSSVSMPPALLRIPPPLAPGFRSGRRWIRSRRLRSALR